MQQRNNYYDIDNSSSSSSSMKKQQLTILEAINSNFENNITDSTTQLKNTNIIMQIILNCYCIKEQLFVHDSFQN